MNASDNFNFGEDNTSALKANAVLNESFGVLRSNTIYPVITRKDGTVEVCTPVKNSRTNSGASFVANQISGTVAAVANYMALAPTQITPAAGDTTLTGEISTNGCARASATYGSYSAPASLNATASYTLTHTFTATGSQAVGSVAVFNASSAGTLLVEAALSQIYSLNSGDSLSITYSFTI